MKKAVKIVKKVFVFLGYTIAVILIVLVCSVLFSKKDYDTPDSPLGEALKSIAIKNVNVISMTKNEEEVQSNMTVLIDHGKITKILPDSIPFHSKYQVKEGAGKFLMPGLIDMHAHIFDRSDLPMYLGYGVTTVRNMMGFPMHLRWKKQVKEGSYPGTNLITASPTINGGNNTGPFHKNIESSESAINAVNTYKEKGYDFIKVYDGLSTNQFASIMKTAKQNNMRVAGHPPKISLKELLQSSIVSIEHTEELLQFLDEEKSEESMRNLARKFKAFNKAVTLNLIAFNRIYKTTQKGVNYYNTIQEVPLNPVIKFIGTKQLEVYTKAGPKYKAYAKTKYEAMKNLSRILVEEGVTVLFGTDSGPNFISAGLPILEEMNLLKDAGVSKFEILKSATRNAGIVLNNQNLGTVTVNAIADLLLLNENPLENLETLKNPEAIVSNNIWYSKKGIEELRNLGKGKASTFMTIGRFLDHLISK
tara:strand:- start:15352 stop:16779 length:1428 start_codon:yes stop_codon:yes gene_type:complete